MSYFYFSYSLIFLPIVMLIYQLCPKRFRYLVILFVNYMFFFTISGALIIYLIGTTIVSYITAFTVDKVVRRGKYKGKKLTKLKRIILWTGISFNVAALVLLKYVKVFGIGTSWIAPIGISYYTLQAISYMIDIYRGTLKFDKNIIKLALFLSFFPQIMEGPISRYNQVADSLYAGNAITYKGLTFGYQRIVWGLFKKILIADRLAPIVVKIFENYMSVSGAAILIGAISFTIQLYMEFSGCMDIVIGTGMVFNVKLPENFRQPFFAKSASEFWRRWHITLGAWLKDYVFYPISLAKPVKKISKHFKKSFGNSVSKYVAPTVALFFVWLGNGVWHGPKSNYLFYGLFYFCIIFFETITESSVITFAKSHNINRESNGYKAFQITKLLCIVVIGEMFFRAQSIYDGLCMFFRIILDFNIKEIPSTNFGVDVYDIVMAIFFSLIVLFVDIIKEKNINICDKINSFRLPVRWTIWYTVILLILIFGAYGKGYSIVDMIYAAY